MRYCAVVVVVGISAAFLAYELREETGGSVDEYNLSGGMDLLRKIAQNVLTKAPSGPDTTFENLWKDHRCVIVFFRRLAAREVSALQPILDKHDTKLVGVGLEPLGVEEFMAGNFFSGELYIDQGKKSYSDLGFTKFGYLGLIPAVLSSASRKAQARAKALGLGGDLKGDGYQNGGAIVVEKGGSEALLVYVQKEAADHASNSEILKALGITVEGEVPTAESTAREK